MSFFEDMTFFEDFPWEMVLMGGIVVIMIITIWLFAAGVECLLR